MAKLRCPEGGTTLKIPGSDPIFVDPEFKGLLDPLSAAELGQLEANIVADKRALDPVVIWKETRIVMDGHNRLDICKTRDLPYKVVFLSFPNTPEGRTNALQWIIQHQTGRRNLSADAKAKLAEWRRERIARLHQEGESNRTIADKEKISESTVRRDIKETGAAIQSPEKVKGRDEKEYPRSRTERVGQKAPTPFVMSGERQPGDDTDQIKTDKKEARSEPRNGQVEFDWAKFNREFANLMLYVDKLGKAHGRQHQKPEATKLRTDLLAWKESFKKWGAAISKKTPTPDTVDKVKAKGRSSKGT